MLHEVVPPLALAAERAPQEFSDTFQASVQLLYDWAVRPGLSDDCRAILNTAFAAFSAQWHQERHTDFSAALHQQVLAELQSAGEHEKLHALVFSFYGLSKAMGNLGAHYAEVAPLLLRCIDQAAQLSGLFASDGQSRFCQRSAWTQRSISLISRGMCHIRLCTSVHLAALRALGAEPSPSPSSAMAALEVLQSGTFRELKALSDVGLRQLCEATWEAMLNHSCGEVLQAACLEKVLEELQELVPVSDTECLHAGVANLQLLQHYSGVLEPKQQQVLSESLRPILAASRQTDGQSEMLLAAKLLRLLDDEALVEWIAEEVSHLVAARPHSKGLRLLQSFSSVPGTFWHCFGGRLKLWEPTFQTADPQALAECALALWRDEPRFGRLLRSCFGQLMDPLCPGEAAARGRQKLWAKLAAARLDLGEALVAPSGVLRSLLVTSSELSSESLGSLLTALRTLSPGDGTQHRDFREYLSSMLWRAPGVPNNLKTLWLLLLAAAFFVSHRLKSPFGSASSSLQMLETMMIESSSKVAQKVAASLSKQGAALDASIIDGSFCPLACVQVVFALEQLILLAQEPVVFKPEVPDRTGRVSKQFFEANRKVCADWFHRMRGLLQHTLARYGSHAATYSLTQARLVDALSHLSSTEPLPLSEHALQVLTRRKAEGAPGLRRELILSTVWPAPSAGDTRDARALMPALEQLEPRRSGGTQRVTILTDPKNSLPSHKAVEALDQNLVPLLSSALRLRDVGLCRGVLALLCHGAWAFAAPTGRAVVLFQDALLCFAQKRYEEANLLFAKSYEDPDAWEDTNNAADVRRLGSGRGLQNLLARTWLDSALEARDEEALQAWLRMHQGWAPEAMVAFAQSYELLLKRDWEASRSALGTAQAASAAAWAAAADADASAARGGEGVARLSRWDDLHALFMVEAAVEVKLGSELAPQALRQARSSLETEISALCHTEPLLLSSLQVHDELHPQLELLDALESPEKTGCSAAALRRAASLDLLEVLQVPEADALMQTCMQERSYKLAEWVLDTQQVLEPSLWRSKLLMAQRERMAEGLQVLDYALASAFTKLRDADFRRGRRAVHHEIAGLSSQLLSSVGATPSPRVLRSLVGLGKHLAAEGAPGQLFDEWAGRWCTALMVPELSTTLPGAQLNPFFMGQWFEQTCQLCDDGHLWGQYADWLFLQAWSLEPAYVEAVLSAALGSAAPPELPQLARWVAQGIRRWVKHESGRATAMSLQWLLKHSKVGQCRCWKDLGEQRAAALAEPIAFLASTFSQWQRAAGAQTIEAYVRHLNRSELPPSHPRVQRAVLRSLRLTERHLQRPSALEWLETRFPEPLLPQLLAYMNGPSTEHSVATVAAGLFERVADRKPHVVLFPALAAEESSKALAIAQRLHPALLGTASRFARALNAMAIPVDEVCARILHFAESFLAPKPVDEVPSCAPQLLGPLLDLLEDLDVEKPHRSGSPSQVLCLMGCAPSLDSVYARRFLQIFLPPLRRMLYLHGPHRLAKGAQELQRSLLAHLHVLQRSCNHFASSSVPLVDLAPDLLQMFQDQEQIILPIDVAPGAPLMRLTRASEVVHLLSTKTKPKKLSFEAQDGTWHSFLLKGSDDLRLDGRIMQLLQMANAVVEAGACKALEALGPTCGTRGLRCRGYDVVPIAARAGLIRWVAAVPLFVIHKQRRQASQKQETEKPKALASADLWHRKIQQHLRAMDSDVNHPRRHWPMEALRRTFDEMQADSPSDLISRELFLSSLHPGQHFLRQRAYTLSTSFSSILGHLIGLGDRHLDNLLLDLTTGEVVHVDYSICFDRGQRLRVPERVPFRLTRCMVHALGPLGLGGPFVQTMEVGLGLIAEWRELILSLMEPCLALAPVNDWVAPVMSPFQKTKEVKEAKVDTSKDHKEEAAPAAPPGLAPSGPAPSAAARSSSEAPVKLEAENQLEWPTLGAAPPPPPPGPPPPPPDAAGAAGAVAEASENSSEESHETPARDEDEDEEGEEGARSDGSEPPNGEEERLLAQDREED
ncbi:unnamed protein product, partial [Durusdinium trenchii]